MRIQLCSVPACREEAKEQCIRCKFVYCLDHLSLYVADYFGIWYICHVCSMAKSSK